MKLKWSIIFSLTFLSLIKSALAQPFPNGGWYSFWDFFWYGEFPYSYFEMSWGFFLLVTCLLTILITVGLWNTKPFKYKSSGGDDKEKKKLAVLVALIISVIVTTTSPFGFWLKDLINLSAWVLTLVLFILIFVGGWTLLKVGWEEGSEQRAKAITKASGARAASETAQSGEHQARVQHRLKREELRELEKIKKHVHEGNIRALTGDVDELKDLLYSESRVIRAINNVVDNMAQKITYVRGSLFVGSTTFITGATPKEKSLFSELTTIHSQGNTLKTSVESTFSQVWNEFTTLKRISDNPDERDRAARVIKLLKSKIRTIHGEEDRIGKLGTRFTSKYHDLIAEMKSLGHI